jgi:hypothetical protein
VRRTGALLLLTASTIVAGAAPAGAQLTSSRYIAVLPFQSSAADSTLAAELYRSFLAGVRPGSFLRLLPPESVDRAVGEGGVRGVLASAWTLQDYASRSGSAFIIGSVVSRTDEGGIELTSAVYAQDDGKVIRVSSQDYGSTGEALAGMDGFARRMSHPRNLTSTDTAFFYSVIVPGLGQLSQGKWKHALASVSLVGLAALYAVTTPDATIYTVPAGRFVIDWDSGLQRWIYTVGGVEYERETFYTVRYDEMRRAERSRRQQRDAETRRDRAKALLVGAWILNVFDTLYLAGRPVDTTRFFQLVSELEPDQDGPLRFSLRLHFPIPGKAGRGGR